LKIRPCIKKMTQLLLERKGGISQREIGRDICMYILCFSVKLGKLVRDSGATIILLEKAANVTTVKSAIISRALRNFRIGLPARDNHHYEWGYHSIIYVL